MKNIILFILSAVITLISSLLLDFIILGDYTENIINTDINSLFRTIIYITISYIFYCYKKKNIIKYQNIIYEMNILFIIFSIIRFINCVFLNSYFREDGLGIDFFLIGVLYLYINIKNKPMKLINLIYIINFIILLVSFFIMSNILNESNSLNNKIEKIFMYLILYIIFIFNGILLKNKFVIKIETYYFNNIFLVIIAIISMIKIIYEIFYEESNMFYIFFIVIVIITIPIVKSKLKNEKNSK